MFRRLEGEKQKPAKIILAMTNKKYKIFLQVPSYEHKDH